jgi:hypothetical protein
MSFANSSIVGSYPYAIFVNTINTVYVANKGNNQVVFWLEGSVNLTKTISGGFTSPYALFVTVTGDIYVDNGYMYGRVDRWAMDATATVPVMYIGKRCYGVFIDINDTLYCSMYDLHQVVAKSLKNNPNTITIVAGTGCLGSASNMLNNPQGIFVDINLDLYVADSNNNRIQRFRSGQFNATTVAGRGASGTITLDSPTSVVLDGNNYLFIVDSLNNRIVGSGPYGFRCLVGCFGAGSAFNQLNSPQSMAFDSYGNMFVTDSANNRIQKFVLLSDSCSKYKNTKLYNRSKTL